MISKNKSLKRVKCEADLYHVLPQRTILDQYELWA